MIGLEEPHFNLFESLSAPLLDRPSDVAPVDRKRPTLSPIKAFGWRGRSPVHFFKPLFASNA